MKAVVDSGPLIAGLDRTDRVHRFARRLFERLGASALVPIPVATEVDYMVRSRAGAASARGLIRALARGGLTPAFLSTGLLRRAYEIDDRYGDLRLGFTDASVMAIAERHELPILTFDFADFRAAPPLGGGHWELVVSEQQLEDAIERS